MMRRLILLQLGLLFQGYLAIDPMENNGYKNVIVSIHPDITVDANSQKTIITNIKEFLSKGSKELYHATEGYAYIHDVNIILPSTWNKPEDAIVSSEYFYEDGDIRINTPNPLYMDNPYTLQPGGCGERGQFIHLTPDFISHLKDSSAETFGPTKKVFVHEWAKLRYGVFEEFGYPGDKQYPLFYYEQLYTDNGPVQELMPNFCTDENLQGTRTDINTGSTCSLDPQTNLPDEDCVFIPIGDNSAIKSSYMAAPFLESVDHFCKNTEVEYHHDIYKPTKHNSMCDYRSTWDVIFENEDFNGVKPMNISIAPPETEFTIMYPDDGGRFVLVLDRSKSMLDASRMDRLKQSSTRWIEYDVAIGTNIGLTSFSTSASMDKDITKVTDSNRQEFINTINALNPNGGTCLGDGLMKGMDVMNGKEDNTQGGAIILITDGKQDCNDGLDIDDPSVINRIKQTKVRIITVAFGKDSDSRLENLAAISGGKTYFVKDGSGLEDINGVFEESNTYQPAVPSNEAEIIISQDTFRKTNGLTREFIIDQTLGRDVKFTVDDLPGNGNSITGIKLFYPNGTLLKSTGAIGSTWSVKFDLLAPGYYRYEILTSGTVDYILMTISSKAKDDQTLPFRTKCWASSDGFEDFDASTTKLAVFAQVEQGNRPVLNAKVEALIEREDQAEAIRIDLRDKGAGSDQIANDGIYSRYFSRYDGFNGRYTLKCQVKGDDETNFIVQKSGTKSIQNIRTDSKSYPLNPTPTSPVCCGSSTGNNIETQPTGNFTRKINGNSFKVKNAPAPDSDLFSPSKVSDLRLIVADYLNVIIDFTAPGDDYDEGTASGYELKFTDNLTELTNEAFWDELTDVTPENIIHGSLYPLPAGEDIYLNLDPKIFEADRVYYLGMKAIDEKDNVSPLSNTIQILVTDTIAPNTVTDFNVHVYGSEDMNILVNFTAPGDDLESGTASEYEVKFTDNITMLESWNEIVDDQVIEQDDLLQGTLTPIIGGSEVKFTINGSKIPEGIPWYMAMKAIDEAKVTSGLSNVVKFERDSTPPSIVTDLNVLISNDSECSMISIEFTAPGDDLEEGTASLYELKFTENMTLLDDLYWGDLDLTHTISKYDVESGSLTPQLSGTKVMIVILGTKFELGVTYYMGIKSYDNLNLASDVSNIVKFERDTIAPNAVTDFNAKVDDSMDIVVEFTAPGDDFESGTAFEYEIKFTDDISMLEDPDWNEIDEGHVIRENNLSQGTLTPIVGGSKVQFTINGSKIPEGIPWYMAMKAIDNAKVTSGLSNIVKFERDSTPPNNVTDLDVQVLEETEKAFISIEFTAPGDDQNSGTASAYELKFTKNITLLNDPFWADLDMTHTISDYDIENGTLAPQSSETNVTIVILGTKFEPGITYYMGMKSYDNLNLSSDVSNIVEFEIEKESGLSGGAMAGIVFGCSAIGMLLVLIGYFVHQKFS